MQKKTFEPRPLPCCYRGVKVPPLSKIQLSPEFLQTLRNQARNLGLYQKYENLSPDKVLNDNEKTENDHHGEPQAPVSTSEDEESLYGAFENALESGDVGEKTRSYAREKCGWDKDENPATILTFEDEEILQRAIESSLSSSRTGEEGSWHSATEDECREENGEISNEEVMSESVELGACGGEPLEESFELVGARAREMLQEDLKAYAEEELVKDGFFEEQEEVRFRLENIPPELPEEELRDYLLSLGSKIVIEYIDSRRRRANVRMNSDYKMKKIGEILNHAQLNPDYQPFVCHFS